MFVTRYENKLYVILILSIGNLKTLETVTVKSQTTASEVLSQGAGDLILSFIVIIIIKIIVMSLFPWSRVLSSIFSF